MKNYIYISKLGLWVEFFVEFFMMNDIAIHQINVGSFKILEFLIENSFI
jgi:hypothetical protein